MTHRRHRNPGDGVFTGLLLIAMGVLFLFGNLNFADVPAILTDWWPLLLVLIGVKRLLVWKGNMAWLSGAFWIGTGLLFLASKRGYIDMDIPRMLWPIILIWFGVAILVGSGSHRNGTFNGRSEP